MHLNLTRRARMLCATAIGLSSALPAYAQTTTSKYSQYENIYTFTGGADGGQPMAGLVMDPQGRLYGTTKLGGTANLGVVFRLTPPTSGAGAWSEEVLHSFTGADGANPVTPVVLGPDGTVYGTAYQGGPYGTGTVFSIAAGQSNVFTILHSFGPSKRDLHSGPPGAAFPSSGLVFGRGGLLYGSTSFYSDNQPAQGGTDYAISPAGDAVLFRILDTFGNAADLGSNPVGLTPVAATTFDNSFHGFVGLTDSGFSGSSFVGQTVYSLRIAEDGRPTRTPLYMYPPAEPYPTGPLTAGKGPYKGSFFGCGAGVLQITLTSATSATSTVIPGGSVDPPYSCFVMQLGYTHQLVGTFDESGYLGGGGIFYLLSPPSVAGQPWTQTNLISFPHRDASESVQGPDQPAGALLLSKGVFYGALSSGYEVDLSGGIYAIPETISP